MIKKYEKLVIPIIILFILGILIAYISAQEYYFGLITKKSGDKLSVFSNFSNSVCGSKGSFVNCLKVSRSKYATLFGIPNAFWGMFFFIFMTGFAASIFFVKEKLKENLMIIE